MIMASQIESWCVVGDPLLHGSPARIRRVERPGDDGYHSSGTCVLITASGLAHTTSRARACFCGISTTKGGMSAYDLMCRSYADRKHVLARILLLIEAVLLDEPSSV